MLDCSTCIRRCISLTIYNNLLPSQRQSLLRGGLRPSTLVHRQNVQSQPWAQSRQYATAVARQSRRDPMQKKQSAVERVYAAAVADVKRTSERGDGSERGAAIAYHQHWKEKYGPSGRPWPATLRRDKKMRRIDMENANKRGTEAWLKTWFKDPSKLAEFTLNTINKGNVKWALTRVRDMSKEMDCTVSWNHLVDHAMKQEHTSIALKLYNEMKKRGQYPDSHTYTIILRGFANSRHPAQVIDKALSVYHSMFVPNSRVKPSIIHTNAIINVCGLLRNLDAMYGVTAKLPESGPGAPDHITYTEILNAIYHDAVEPVSHDETPEQRSSRQEKAIMDGKRLWPDVVSRWKSGTLKMDERLVNAMGRLLLLGSPKDNDDVLSLVHQTMGVPRQIPSLGSPEHMARHVPGIKDISQERYRDQEHEDSESPKAELVPSPRLPTDSNDPSGSEFKPLEETPASADPRNQKFINGSRIPKIHPFSFARASNATLSLVMESCIRLRVKNTAAKYWSMLTDPHSYNVIPDTNNLHNYLRILRDARASTDTLSVIQSLPNEALRPSSFLIALSTCYRNRKNPTAFQNATEIIQMMTNKFEDAQPRPLAKYAALARDTENGIKMQQALELLNPNFTNLRSLSSYGRAIVVRASNQETEDSTAKEESDEEEGEETSDSPALSKTTSEQTHIANVTQLERSATIELAQNMISIYDWLISHGEIMPKGRGYHVGERKRISAWLARNTHASEMIEYRKRMKKRIRKQGDERKRDGDHLSRIRFAQ
ncbi:MAG: hypothetical protein M1834_006669 [Cirrosporium novae-zelandiae]|nr:MAG: hypothetical protein M1834_006669 [Cirrosporium novae-zelandiae]